MNFNFTKKFILFPEKKIQFHEKKILQYCSTYELCHDYKLHELRNDKKYKFLEKTVTASEYYILIFDRYTRVDQILLF